MDPRFVMLAHALLSRLNPQAGGPVAQGGGPLPGPSVGPPRAPSPGLPSPQGPAGVQASSPMVQALLRLRRGQRPRGGPMADRRF